MDKSHLKISEFIILCGNQRLQGLCSEDTDSRLPKVLLEVSTVGNDLGSNVISIAGAQKVLIST